MLVDSHAHLYLEEFSSDITQVLERAAAAGVKNILLPNIDSNTVEAMLLLESTRPEQCHAMMGLHPCSVRENVEKELMEVENWLGKRSFAAVGEIGLDFHWDLTYREQQVLAFEKQIDWAKQYQVPVSIHSRDATRDCIKIVKRKQDGSLKGVFHCFSGTLSEAKEIIGLGFYLGIGGVVTFKNSGLDQMLKELDMAYIVLETDSPYLAPVPHRGKRNESSFLGLVAEKIAFIKGLQIEEIASITSDNAGRLFNLPLNK